MVKEQIVIIFNENKKRYYYGRHGCMLNVCYYDRPKPETKPVSECDDCPYGKCGSCIGWCTKEILRSLERGRAK